MILTLLVKLCFSNRRGYHYITLKVRCSMVRLGLEQEHVFVQTANVKLVNTSYFV